MTTKKSNPSLLYCSGAPLRWLKAATEVVEQNLVLAGNWQRARPVRVTVPATAFERRRLR